MANKYSKGRKVYDGEVCFNRLKLKLYNTPLSAYIILMPVINTIFLANNLLIVCLLFTLHMHMRVFNIYEQSTAIVRLRNC